MNCARLAVQKNMRALALIPLLVLVACSVQQQAVTVPPGTCVVDCPPETTSPSSAHAEPPPQDDRVAAAIQQGNMQNWQAQQQGNFWNMIGAMR